MAGRRSLFYFLITLLVITNQPTLSCSMDMISASSLVIKEIISAVQLENLHSDREITKIHKTNNKKFSYWTYLIETSKNGAACKAVIYSAVIDPACNVKVQRLNNTVCGS